MFGLHGQIVICKENIFQQFCNNTYYLGSLRWQIAIRINLINPIVIVSADYERIAQYIFTSKQSRKSRWDINRNWDPLDNWEEYRGFIQSKISKLQQNRTNKSIYDLVRSNPHLFNGFGGNHTTEALHYAGIHPIMSAYTVFQHKRLREQFFNGLYEASRLPKNWEKYISKLSNLNAPWEMNERG